ncbi:MAG TPA: SH3 domain-containing protein, partial [Burkholderiaceae bacterium]|nr:SH3 domain-containing protein [Burkholderiaceae bacterium]
MITRSWTAPLAAIATLAALAMPAAAQAQYAQTAGWVNLRAGPARDYPLVASLPPGVAITVQGCIAGYSWCDVIGPAGERGWIYAGKIVYPYQAGYVPVIQYGAVIGIPIVTFAIGSYWGDYYRHRPWYGN